MDLMLKQLEREEDFLDRQIRLLTNRIPGYPSGSLHISSSNGVEQFYIWNKDENGKAVKKKYIRKADRLVAVSIAQRDYEMKLLKELQTRQSAVKKARKVYEKTAPENVQGVFPHGKRVLIKPLFCLKEEYIRRWLALEYERKPFEENTAEIYTARGERVRSKSEKIIADTLLRFGVPYRYEAPLELKGYGRVHPDFTVLNAETRQEFYWEHLGRMDDERYIKDAMIRIQQYQRNNILPGLDIILTFETKTMPLDIKVLDNVIQRFLL